MQKLKALAIILFFGHCAFSQANYDYSLTLDSLIAIDTISILNHFDSTEVNFNYGNSPGYCDNYKGRWKYVATKPNSNSLESNIDLKLLTYKNEDNQYIELHLDKYLLPDTTYKISVSMRACELNGKKFKEDESNVFGTIRIFEISQDSCVQNKIYMSEPVRSYEFDQVDIYFVPRFKTNKLRLENFYKVPTFMAYDSCLEFEYISNIVAYTRPVRDW